MDYRTTKFFCEPAFFAPPGLRFEFRARVFFLHPMSSLITSLIYSATSASQNFEIAVYSSKELSTAPTRPTRIHTRTTQIGTIPPQPLTHANRYRRASLNPTPSRMAPPTLQLIRRPPSLEISDTIIFPPSRQSSARAPCTRIAQNSAEIAELRHRSHSNIFRQRSGHCDSLFVFKSGFVIVVVVFVVTSAEAFALLEPPCRYSRDQRYRG